MIYVIRHGQTDWNKERRMQGRRGLPLNDHGIEQAHSLRDALNGIRFDHVFSSPQERALQTAEIVSGRSPVIDERLNVIDLGEADGVLLEELKRVGPLPDPEIYKGIEDPKALVRRVFHFMNELQDTHGREENILIVRPGASGPSSKGCRRTGISSPSPPTPVTSKPISSRKERDLKAEVPFFILLSSIHPLPVASTQASTQRWTLECGSAYRICTSCMNSSVSPLPVSPGER